MEVRQIHYHASMFVLAVVVVLPAAVAVLVDIQQELQRLDQVLLSQFQLVQGEEDQVDHLTLEVNLEQTQYHHSLQEL